MEKMKKVKEKVEEQWVKNTPLHGVYNRTRNPKYLSIRNTPVPLLDSLPFWDILGRINRNEEIVKVEKFKIKKTRPFDPFSEKEGGKEEEEVSSRFIRS